MNSGKEGEIESGRSAELENCGQAEVEDHLRMRIWNLLVMVMRMLLIIENGSIPNHYLSESIMRDSRRDTWASASATTRNNTSQGGCQLSADSCDASTAPIWCY